ncbi:hypothetical protein CIB95_12320 [Lottiidibacillus patelloidae]|uniref:DUF2971 domain-containing protein n=1 Tax=Lottiidibacillus patelloidae TaxID=2670334 RepID=A0A263BR78_9BACI|nr:DUF2971 domain-containing protein [Lottiidibacillus patelloidae]OZM56205.1 hypothetical protein CIB95_12320 [Lottiidibacillus patelloidae]
MKEVNIPSYLYLPLKISTNSNILFHYTNIDAIFSIFKQEKLWFSKSDFLNDPSEIHYIQDVLNEVCDQLQLSMGAKEFKREISKLFSREHPLPKDVYILSLTDNSDSLTLWSNYSEFVGYNIGLNISSLISSLENQHISYNHGKVVYDRKNQKRIIEQELKIFYNYWSMIDSNQKLEQLQLLNALFNRMFIYSIFFKKSPFYQEEEYRVALLFDNVATNNNSNNHHKFPVCFRTFNEVLIPYIEVPILNNEGFLPIESITIGPKNTIDIATEGLKYFLKVKKYDFVDVQKSNIPLRY